MSTARIAVLFAGAVELGPDERNAYLDANAAGEPELRAEVEALLAAHDAAGGFLEAPLDAARAAALLADEPAATTAAEREAERIGPYRVVREIGRGGMGTVYLAERADGAFEQQVALKVLERGDDSHEKLRRFLRERQILARLHHPLIAQLHDGGITSDGRPYFAMELVDGVPITRYCAERGASVEERLRLLRDVCRAVQHAHAGLVVHRDLKPSNVLVTAAGEVKLLDFGIAALLAEADPEALAITATSESLMTPQYGSPEQFRGDAITTASDVYQLGLIAYELLAGCRPYSLKGVSLNAARRLVCETMPEPPSRRREDDAPTSSTGPQERAPLPRLSGELDTIVLKALQKEPSARYASADQFADDVERFLAGLPIAARAPTVAYRFRKFLGRHTVASAGVALALGAMSTMAVLFTVRLIHERDQTRAAAARAERRQLESEEITRFLVELFEVADPAREGPTITARELLDRGAARIEQELSEQPQVRARLLRAIGDTYRRLGLYDEAESQLRRSLEIAESTAADPMALADSLESLGIVLRERGRLDEADSVLQRASSLLEEHLGPDHEAVGRLHYQLGHLRRRQGRLAEAEALNRQAVAMLRGVGAPADLAEILDGHGQVLEELGRFDEAASAYGEAIALLESSVGGDHPRLATPLNSLAVLQSGLGRHAVSKPLFERAHGLLQAAYGADHPKTLSALNNLGIDHLELGELDLADAAFERVERSFMAGDDPDSSQLAQVVLNRGNVALERGEHARAEAHYRRALTLSEQALPGHPQIGLALHNLGEATAAQGRDAEAEAFFERSLAVFEAGLGEKHLLVSWPTFHLARLYRRRGDPARAEPLLRRALEIRRRDLEPSSSDLREVEEEWAELERELGRPGGVD